MIGVENDGRPSERPALWECGWCDKPLRNCDNCGRLFTPAHPINCGGPEGKHTHKSCYHD